MSQLSLGDFMALRADQHAAEASKEASGAAPSEAASDAPAALGTSAEPGETAPAALVELAPSTPGGSDVEHGDLVQTGAQGPCVCCSCHRSCTADGSLVIIKQSTKAPEVRRCRSCHNVRAAIQRLSKAHGALVQDFFAVGQSDLQDFYQKFGHLRGNELRVKIEETVTTWKTNTTRFQFNQDASFLSEEDLREHYAHKKGGDETVENILKNGRRFFCPVKQQMLYGDPSYSARVQDEEERGETKKRKGVLPLSETAEPVPTPDGEAAGKKPKKEKEEKKVKMKVGVRNKMEKKKETLSTSRLQLLDMISKCESESVKAMIPAYVVAGGSKVASKAAEVIEMADAKLEEGLVPVEPIMEALQTSLDDVSDMLNRVRTQLEQAQSFK